MMHALKMMDVILLSSLLATSYGFSPVLTRHVSSTTSTSLAAAPCASSALFGVATTRLSSQSSMFSVPSIFNEKDSRPVVLFDGKCNLCNAGVQLVLDYDSASKDERGNLRVAALQSRVGQILLARLPASQRNKVQSSIGGEYKSIVVTSPNKTWLNSNACVYIGKQLRGPLKWLAMLASLTPSFLRDPLYKLMSRYRKKFFGETPECRLWDDNWDMRFVDDGMFGGRSESDDPFADPSKVSDESDEEEIDVENVLPPNEGDTVRVVSNKPIVHNHIEGYEEGLCSVGLLGTVSRVLNQKAYPKSVAVAFTLEGKKFEAHFYPGQLKRE